MDVDSTHRPPACARPRGAQPGDARPHRRARGESAEASRETRRIPRAMGGRRRYGGAAGRGRGIGPRGPRRSPIRPGGDGRSPDPGTHPRPGAGPASHVRDRRIGLRRRSRAQRGSIPPNPTHSARAVGFRNPAVSPRVGVDSPTVPRRSARRGRGPRGTRPGRRRPLAGAGRHVARPLPRLSGRVGPTSDGRHRMPRRARGPITPRRCRPDALIGHLVRSGIVRPVNAIIYDGKDGHRR
jgi:hypothetical protein